MDIINGIFRLQDKYREISIALGTFDGVHLGHRKIIQRVVESARLQQGTSVVFTFDPHPRMVLKPDLLLP
ncbi:MAG TPA: bifunctional riboflavin kinase/FMN adenylyltransferase, partial [Firmicutes bacterium]|nr:bifunctional riboflavin kinase/FMN adenylyltransferase [Bacillota bacterium]